MKSDQVEQLHDITESSHKMAPSNQYAIILHNDDYTPMDFVVQILMDFFAHDFENALTLMWQVHATGSAVCGIYRLEIAETKVAQVIAWSRQHEYPLRCSYKKLD